MNIEDCKNKIAVKFGYRKHPASMVNDTYYTEVAELYAKEQTEAISKDRDYHKEQSADISIEFAEWINTNRYSKYWGSDEPNCNKWYVQYSPPSRKYFTTKELYDIFLKSKLSSHE